MAATPAEKLYTPHEDPEDRSRTSLYHFKPTGEMELCFHPGQQRAWDSMKRVVMVLAGTQGGKTSWGPFWLAREIQMRGPGDYLVAAPTFKLLSLKLFPEFLKLFKTHGKWGNFTGKGSFQHRFLFNDYGCRVFFGHVPEETTQIFFGHAQDPDSLESATAKAAWLDEAGQRKFKLGSYEAVRRRLSIRQGRLLITTTPYSTGWLHDVIYSPWKKARLEGKEHPQIDVVQFRSTENPSFPLEEYESAKMTLPVWKHRMFYDGEFERPAGAVFEDYDEELDVVEPFEVPDHWPRFIGLDFGGVHTAGVYLAKGKRTLDSPEEYYLYREYPERARWGSGTARTHVKKMLKGEPFKPKAYGGAASEKQWREEFRAGGLYVYEPPIKEVEVGIDRVNSMFKNRKLKVFSTCLGVRDHLKQYSRMVDENGEPTETIEDKEDYHYCFVDGTKIMTSKGDVPIEDLRTGDEVLTRQGWCLVIAHGRRWTDLVQLNTDIADSLLVGTADHPVWVIGRGLVGMGMLCPGDDLYYRTSPDSDPITTKVTSLSFQGLGMVYNLTVDRAHEYFANGVLVSNCDALRYIASYIEGGRKEFWIR